MVSPKVTVIVPTFDREASLGSALESVLAQDHRDLELIVVDDGSTDGTAALVRALAARDGRVRLIQQENGGVSRARNAGLAAATGEHIAFLDSDDTMQRWHLGLLLAALERFPEAGLAWSEMEMTDRTGTLMTGTGLSDLLGAYRGLSRDAVFRDSAPVSDLKVAIPAAYGDRRIYLGDLYSTMLKGNLVLTSSSILRRETVDRTGTFDERLTVGEDHDFFHRATRNAPAILVDVPGVRYRSGTADKLARPGNALAIARAYLDLVERALATDRSRITLTPDEIAAARAHALRWVGELELAAGARRPARRHLGASVRARPAQPAAVLALGLSFLPAGLIRRLLDLRRAARGRAAAVSTALR